MNWSTERKTLSIMVIIGALFLLAVPVVWYVYPRASCTDGKQNQGERGIDCGGPCTTRCPIDIAAIAVDWVRPVRVAPGLYSVVARVTNANVGLEAADVPYVIRLFSATGAEIYKRTGTLFMPQNSSVPVFEGTLTVGEKVPIRATFELQGQPAWRPATKHPTLAVRDIVLSAGPESPRLSATLVNPGVGSVSSVVVTALLYDEEDNVVAASQTFVESIPADASRSVVFTWREPFAANVVREEIIPLVR